MSAFYGGSALESQAQPAPANDNIANAQVIQGVSGAVQGTNLQATVEAGETIQVAGVLPQSTIWYVWTAPTSLRIDFNTRNSTDPYGLPLGTTLGVYTQKAAGPLTVANLTLVAGNENDPSGGLTSRVDFNAAFGTTYLIQVGSTTNEGDGYAQGYPDLNWGPSLVAGGFGFSTTTYLMSSMENWLPDNDNQSISPSIYGFNEGTPNFNQGDANARITVTRTPPAMGRCEVTLTANGGFYTNTYLTNYYITNVYITNYTTNGTILFTNILITNIASINEFADFQSGGIISLPVDGDVQTTETNANGVIGYAFTNLFPGTFGLPSFFTNFTCNAGTSFLSVSNTDGSTTLYTTNVFCNTGSKTTALVSALAPGSFTPFTNTLIFDDYQMSQDVYVQIFPILNPTYPGGRPNSVKLVDFPTAGPEDAISAYFYQGLNTFVQLSLSNPTLDPRENPDIVPPSISQPNAFINIENFYGNPNVLFSNNTFATPIAMLNFERYTYRCNKDCGTAVVWVQRSDRNVTAQNNSTHILHYTLDSKIINVSWIDDNKFATVAGSDYAVPSNAVNQVAYDFLAPLTAGTVYRNNKAVPATTTWGTTSGTLTFPALPDGTALNAQGIYIPIIENGAVEFDEDIELQLYLTDSDAKSDAIQPPGYPAMLGAITTARLTINFDNVLTNQVQPGGALDRNYNPNNDLIASFPPGNLEPGANSPVNAVAIDAGGNAVIGGDFTAYNTTPINYLARILPSGWMDLNFAAALGRGPQPRNGFVNATVIDSSQRIIIGGNFLAFNATPAFHVARLLPSGALDTSFATGLGFNGNVYALAVDANGNIVVGGDFTSYNTTNCNHIARLLPNGTLDTSFLPSSGTGVNFGADQYVRAVAVDYLGNVILGGNFTTVNGTNWNHIARLLPNGNLDTSFNPGFGADGEVLALAVQPDNSIILGGAFQNFNLISRSSIARLTPGGVLDTGFAPGSGFDDSVDSLLLQPDGNILVGGQFTKYNGNRRVGLARVFGGQGLHAGQGGWLDTSFMDTAYNQFAGVINHYYNTNAYDRSQFPSPLNSRNQVLAMGLQPDNNVVIGGSFTRVGGGFSRTDSRVRLNLARVIGPATPGPEQGGLGNCPGNLGMTQNPYSADDTGLELFVTLMRTNGSLGPVETSLAPSYLPPSSSSATPADFGLLSTGLGYGISLYDDVWSLPGEVAFSAYGWRVSDGEYGLNANPQPTFDQNAWLFLGINNDPPAAPILYANLNLLNLNANNLMSLGGVSIPLGPALGQYTAGLDIVNANYSSGTIGFSATNYNVLESGGTVTVTLLRTNGSYGSPSVTVNAVNGTAKDGPDYFWTTETKNFASGQTMLTFTIPIVDHNTQQTNKFFKLYLSSPTAGATLDTTVPPLVPSNSIVTIIDDHFTPGYLSLSSPAYSVLKPGVATISVIRTGAALGQLSVQCGTSNGSAINNVNYVGVTNTLTWASQDISPKTMTVQTLEDNTVEGPKTVNVFLFNPQAAGNSQATNAQVLASPSNAVLTIQDTDSYGNLNFLMPNFTVFQNSGQALVTVTRTGGTIGTETVQFMAYALTNVQLPFLAAAPGVNYGATNGLLTFGPGVSSQSFTVPVFSTPSESKLADRLVGLQLFNGNPTNIAAQFPKIAVLTILDPQLHINSAGSVDATTQNGAGFDNPVNSLALQPDASILAAGEFAHFNGYPFANVGRLLPSGNYDTGFLFNLSGPNGTVWQVLSQTPAAGQIDGNVMIVGDFSQVNLVNSPRIARLNLNGALDTSFNPGAGADGSVYAIAQMLLPASASDPTTVPYFVIGGAFANYNGNAASGVARVTLSGSMTRTLTLASA